MFIFVCCWCFVLLLLIYKVTDNFSILLVELFPWQCDMLVFQLNKYIVLMSLGWRKLLLHYFSPSDFDWHLTITCALLSSIAIRNRTHFSSCHINGCGVSFSDIPYNYLWEIIKLGREHVLPYLWILTAENSRTGVSGEVLWQLYN